LSPGFEDFESGIEPCDCLESFVGEVSAHRDVELSELRKSERRLHALVR